MLLNNLRKTGMITRNLIAKSGSVSVTNQPTRAMAGILTEKVDRHAEYKNLAITVPKPFVVCVELNRAKRYNAFNKEMWIEIKHCFESLHTNPDCRVIVISGAGKHFSAGIDLNDMIKLGQDLADIDDVARKGHYLEPLIKLYQDSISSLENCSKPVIAAVHSACIGAGIDLITAADIRYCTEDAFFSVKEVDIGMAADVGTLQRLPKAIGSQSLARELCYTGRRMESSEALSCGLVNRVFPEKEALLKAAIEMAEHIAQKSPIAVQTTKQNIVYSLSRPNQEGLDQIRIMNKLYLLSEDLAQAAAAQLTKDDKPTFSKL
ncbi:delta(3,5)-Delta(2,4)-dienoyl-CoA isomerase, mitochondrial [Stomoxys calcitrans]|uniref:Delta(3,5)-Delta(2,4)-dienoyl-CoA isomerase, mitochondrial n=1 Tax=Stomoxys calcitrans TaxID=35570 RepID=A0A1I8Q7B8_STOCA|nr:delta(3,5)-Delta(2,4)-dienoyl-CoA isomerase, mitochondrial [Stomoxys calcitrans]